MNAAEKVLYLDRRVAGDSPGVSVSYSGGQTTWTLPYLVDLSQTEGVLVVVRTDTNELLPAQTRATENSVRAPGDHTAVPVYIGILYRSSYTINTLYLRDGEDSPETRGRLQLRYLNVQYGPSTDLTVRVDRQGRGYTDLPVSHAAAKAGTVTVPVMTQNTQATIEIYNETPGGCAIAGLDWEGFYTTRSRRM